MYPGKHILRWASRQEHANAWCYRACMHHKCLHCTKPHIDRWQKQLLDFNTTESEPHLIIVIDLRRGQCQDIAGLRLVLAHKAKECGRGVVQPAHAEYYSCQACKIMFATTMRHHGSFWMCIKTYCSNTMSCKNPQHAMRA